MNIFRHKCAPQFKQLTVQEHAKDRGLWKTLGKMSYATSWEVWHLYLFQIVRQISIHFKKVTTPCTTDSCETYLGPCDDTWTSYYTVCLMNELNERYLKWNVSLNAFHILTSEITKWTYVQVWTHIYTDVDRTLACLLDSNRAGNTQEIHYPKKLREHLNHTLSIEWIIKVENLY